MDIQPTTPGRTSGTGPGRAEKAHKHAPVRPDAGSSPRPTVGSDTRDELEISAVARELQAQPEPDAAAGSDLTPDRMREILARIASGHYDRPDVRDTLAHRIADVLAEDTRIDPASRA